VIATLSLDFFDYLRAPEIERAVVELENRIRSAYPEVSALFVKPQSVLVAAERRRAGGGGMTPDPSETGASGGRLDLRPASRVPVPLRSGSGASCTRPRRSRIEIELAPHAFIGFLGLRRLGVRVTSLTITNWSPLGEPGKPRPRRPQLLTRLGAGRNGQFDGTPQRRHGDLRAESGFPRCQREFDLYIFALRNE